MVSIKIINKNKVIVKMFLFLLLLIFSVYILSNAITLVRKINFSFLSGYLAKQGINSASAFEVERLKSYIQAVLPIIKISSGEQEEGIAQSINTALIREFIGFDIKRFETIIQNEILMMNGYEALAVNSSFRVGKNNVDGNLDNVNANFLGNGQGNKNAGEGENEGEDEKENVVGDKASGKNDENSIVEKEFIYPKNKYINNGTDIDVDANKLLNEKLKIKFAKKGPTVLIIHTHTSEAYTPTQSSFYVPSDTDRTEKPEYNVVRVGQELAKNLKDMGIEVIHDKTVHDFPSYKGSYNNSLKTAQDIINKYPSIRFVFDIHRDAFLTEDGKKLKVTTEIDGKKSAQVMFVVGTNASGLEHPNWQENLKLALKFQERMNNLTPGLARPINLTKYRYNQHTTAGSLILEVGSNGNTLEEALLGCRHAAKAIGGIITQK